MSKTTEHFTSNGQQISVDLFSPEVKGLHPAALILHGTYGLEPPFGPAILSFAEALVEKGIAAAIPAYFMSTKTTAGKSVGVSTITTHFPAWTRACIDALTFTAQHAGTDAARLGIVGFSLGGRLALNLAMQPPPATRLKCVVDFFGPTDLLERDGSVSALPPVLIHHGTADKDVDFRNSTALVSELVKAGKIEGKDFVFREYKDQGHGFTGEALTASRDATVGFVEEWL